jgi:hypothetical protein
MEVNKMLKKRTKIALIAAASILIMASSGFCLDSLIVNISNAGFMTNPENSNDIRAVIDFDLPNTLDSSCRVTVAELRIAASVAQQIDYPLSLRINPVTTDWSFGNVNWMNPWTNPGGDYNDSLTAFGHIRQAGDSDVRIDVTRLIQSFKAGNTSNYGFLIRQVGEQLRTYSFRQMNVPGGNALVQLAIYYFRLDT